MKWRGCLLLVIPVIYLLNSNIFAQDSYNQLRLLLQEGKEARQRGDFRDALEIFLKAQKIGTSTEGKEIEYDVNINLGYLYWNLGQTEDSLSVFKKARDLARRARQKDKLEFCSSIIDIYRYYSEGKKLRDQDANYQASIESFNKAIEIARRLDSKEHEIKCLRQLSISYQENNQLKDFFQLNNRALLIAKPLNIKREIAYCTLNIGLYYYKNSIYSLALDNYEQSLAIARELEDVSDQADFLMGIGNIYSEMGRFDKALDYLTLALDAHRRLQLSEQVAADLLNIGIIYRRRSYVSGKKEDLQKAISNYKASLKIMEAISSPIYHTSILNNIGSVYYDLGQYSEALDYFREGLSKAEEYGNVELRSLILNNIGIVQAAIGNYGESTKYYQQAIDLATQIQGGQILWEAYLEMANTLKRQKKLSLALDNYKNSIAVIEEIRSNIKLEELKASFLGTDKRLEAYQEIIDLLNLLHKSDPKKRFDKQAFEYLERAKARAFLDSLEVANVDISQSVDFKLLNREKEIMASISKLHAAALASGLPEDQKSGLRSRIRTYEQEYESLKREIRLTSPAYANLKFPEIITLIDVQNSLIDSNTQVFAYSVGKNRSYAFAITKHGIKMFAFPPRQEIQAQVIEYVQTITDKENRDFSLGQQLFRTLVAPGLEKGITQLLIIPDDLLNLLPFEALLTDEKSQDWLISKYVIGYAPSLSSLKEIINRSQSRDDRPKKDLLALGDPYYSEAESGELMSPDSLQGFFSGESAPLSRMKFSGREVSGIASLFSEKRTRTLVRENASEANLIRENLPDYRILHFAVHGLIDDKNPSRSSLLLAQNPSSAEDGFLQMREILNLHTHADLVTLSSCQTGLGQLIRGEGVEGLNRAFFYAGASSVMISLWAVNDQASYQFMERFYAYLRSSQSIGKALQKAKLDLIESDALSHPYYWAGFIITGKANTVLFPRMFMKWMAAIFLLLVVVMAIVILIKKLRKPR